MAGELRPESDIFSRRVEMRFCGMRTCPDDAPGINLQKAKHAATVVVVPMREHGGVYGAEVKSHSVCIFRESVRSSGIEQDSVP